MSFNYNNNENINSTLNNIIDLNNNTLNTSTNNNINNSNININNNDNQNQSAIINHNNIKNIMDNISAIHDLNQNINNSFNYTTLPNNINNINTSLSANNTQRNNIINLNNNNTSLNNISGIISQNTNQNIELSSFEEKSKYIISLINKTISNLHLDPILCSMQNEPMLHEFYKSRILEIISEKLTNEQEKQIDKLQKQNTQLNHELSVMSNKFSELNKYSNEEKEKIIQNIKNLEKELEIKTEQNTKLFEQIESLTAEINLKNQQIIFFQNNIENIKTKQEEMKNYLNQVMEQNSKLTNDNKDLVKKIEELKIDYQNNMENLNNKYNELQKENETVLKVKILALRNKLREKVNIINKLTNNSNDIGFENDINNNKNNKFI